MTCYSNTPDSCITCKTEDMREQLGNYCPCISHYLDTGKQTCDICRYSCKECTGDVNNCVDCTEISRRVYSQSLDSDNKLRGYCNCPLKYPIDEEGTEVCYPCHHSCKECSTKNDSGCSSCTTTHYRELIDSYCPCELHFFDVGRAECDICSDYCLGCVEKKTTCTSCYVQD